MDGACEAPCTLCHDICPAHAIEMNKDSIPHLNINHCTNCTACVHICPTDAIIHEAINPVEIVKQASELVRQGKTSLHATCSEITEHSADLSIPCHAAWEPILLACLAAEGIRYLNLIGLHQCASCPRQYGAEIMAATEKDYDVLNKSLDIHLNISRDEPTRSPSQTQQSASEPARRAFFRNLFPNMVGNTIKAVGQLNQRDNDESHVGEEAIPVNLPVRLRLFLRALPRLQANFTPVPNMPSLPLGAIQADARCTACGQCVEQCPTQALNLREFGTNMVLDFSPDACIACWQCVDQCPEQAIESLPAISLPSLLTRRERPLVMVQAKDVLKKP